MSPRNFEFQLFLSDALEHEDPRPTDEQLEMYASSFLVPAEYDVVRSRPCPDCGHAALRVREQRTRDISEHPCPASWPYRCPAGDALLVTCTDCGSDMTLVFWFRQ